MSKAVVFRQDGTVEPIAATHFVKANKISPYPYTLTWQWQDGTRVSFTKEPDKSLLVEVKGDYDVAVANLAEHVAAVFNKTYP